MDDFSTSGVKRRRAIILIIGIAIIIIGFLIYKGWDRTVNSGLDRTEVITGSFSCLPNKDGSEPERGCVLGLKSREGSYYALDISRIQDANTDLKVDDTIAVTGFILPESRINGSDWEQYNIEAIILVNTLLRTR